MTKAQVGVDNVITNYGEECNMAGEVVVLEKKGGGMEEGGGRGLP